MSPENTSQKLNNPGITDEEKRRKHAEAQRKYRERNLEATREKARERMSRLRESAKPLKARLQRKQRRGRDADESRGMSALLRKGYARENSSPNSGQDAFHDYYLPHLRLLADDEHDLNARKFWFLVLRAGLFTKRPTPTIRLRPPAPQSSPFARAGEADAHWAAHCRDFHTHGGQKEEDSEEEGDRSSSPPPFPTPRAFHTAFDDTSTLHPGQDRARLHQARGVRLRQARGAFAREGGGQSPLFRDDGEVSPLSRPRKRPTPPSPPSSRKRSPSATAHSVSPRTPGPDASPSHASPPSTGTSAGSISSVSSLSASVGSSASRAAPPLRSLPWYPPSSRPAAPYSHAGSSARVGAGTQARHHAEPPVLFKQDYMSTV
ncbi:hypothetical protein B0H14DRAFT_3475059 [Mycena olivaceomarginata]|nr:hypothetical protein B0H14DRAFT_3475059 [Mycena olivaceomarginata]